MKKVVIGGWPGHWYLTWDTPQRGLTAEYIFILAGPFRRRGQAENALADYQDERKELNLIPKPPVGKLVPQNVIKGTPARPFTLPRGKA